MNGNINANQLFDTRRRSLVCFAMVVGKSQ
jgi:hypothetical protein